MRHLLPLFMLVPGSAFAGVAGIVTERQTAPNTVTSVTLFFQHLLGQLAALLS